MNWERFAFPALIVAAVATIWYVFRGGAQAPAAAGTAVAATDLPQAAPLVLQLPQVQGSTYVQIPPARFDPPRELRPPMLTGLRYPADLQASDVVGDNGMIPAVDGGGPGGCCCPS